MPKVFRLAYLDLVSDDVERDSRFYTDVIGMSEAETAEHSTYLTLGCDHHNLRIVKGEARTLGPVGYQLNPGLSLAQMQRDLSAQGISSRIKSDLRPGVGQLLELEAIGGHVIQLFSDMETPAAGFNTHGVSPVSIGHFALFCPDGKRLVKLYREALGFYPTDWFGDVIHFMTCNYSHHTLNIVDVPVPHRLHHLAFQLRDYGQHAKAADVVAADKRKILWGPTRHTAGHNIASYFRDPSDRLIELYCDMDVYIPELDIMEPRPWHSQLPMRPRHWNPGDVANWGTDFEFSLKDA